MFLKLYAIFCVFAMVLINGIKEFHCHPNYIDLTHPFKNGGTRTFPGNKPFEFTIVKRGFVDFGGKSNNVYVEMNELFMASNVCLKIITFVSNI